MQARANVLFRSFWLATLLVAGVPGSAAAQDWRPSSLFVQGGRGEDGVGVASLGALWPWAWRRAALGGELTAQTELFGSVWRARNLAGDREHFVQLGLLPVLRYRFTQGRSPWFVEGGIGLSVTDKRFVTREKEFSTRLNFSDNVAVGRSIGEDEVSLRVQHTSNAGLKKPNPGLNLVMVRYARAF